MPPTRATEPWTIEAWYTMVNQVHDSFLYQGVFEQYSSALANPEQPSPPRDVFTPITEGGQGTLSPVQNLRHLSEQGGEAVSITTGGTFCLDMPQVDCPRTL